MPYCLQFHGKLELLSTSMNAQNVPPGSDSLQIIKLSLFNHIFWINWISSKNESFFRAACFLKSKVESSRSSTTGCTAFNSYTTECNTTSKLFHCVFLGTFSFVFLLLKRAILHTTTVCSRKTKVLSKSNHSNRSSLLVQLVLFLFLLKLPYQILALATMFWILFLAHEVGYSQWCFLPFIVFNLQ